MIAISLAASTAAFQAGGLLPAQQPAVARMPEVSMYTGGAARKRAPAKKGPAATPGLFSSGKAPAKGKTLLSVSAAPTKRSYLDVTGQPYQEVSTFVPKFDEIGVLPPLGRWDPLKIREQVHARPAARAHGRCAQPP